jgi:D-xylose transport system permease protein
MADRDADVLHDDGASAREPEAPVAVGPDLTAAEAPAEALVPVGILAQTLPEYLRGQLLRIKSGDSGLLPVFLALIIIVVVFQVISPSHVFLTAGNIVNLFQQSAVFMVLAMAETFALLLGEIDLSIGYSAACAATITVQLVQPTTTNWPWWAAIIAGLAFGAAAGFVMGTLITRLRLPAFIVTLGGFLVFEGLQLYLVNLGPFSGIPSLLGMSPNLNAIHELMWGVVSPLAGWIIMAVIVGLLGLNTVVRDTRRRRSGLVAPPPSITITKVVLMAVGGIAVVAICNVNRAATGTLEGVPYVILIVFGVLALWTVLLQRMRYGRYVYAIGGNPESARRAGINVSMTRTLAFTLCGLTAAVAGLLYASYLGGMSSNINGGQYVLYAVAAAVIGGVSLFGGRGKVGYGVLGGLVIGAIYNGMFLLGLAAQWTFIVTGLVLIGAVTIDALSRRGSRTVVAGRP